MKMYLERTGSADARGQGWYELRWTGIQAVASTLRWTEVQAVASTLRWTGIQAVVRV